MRFRTLNWISVTWGHTCIIVDTITKNKKNKLDVPLGTELMTSCLQSQSCTIRNFSNVTI